MTSPCWPQPTSSLWQSSGCTAKNAGVLAFSLIWVFQRCAATALKPGGAVHERDGPADAPGHLLGRAAGRHQRSRRRRNEAERPLQRRAGVGNDPESRTGSRAAARPAPRVRSARPADRRAPRTAGETVTLGQLDERAAARDDDDRAPPAPPPPPRRHTSPRCRPSSETAKTSVPGPTKAGASYPLPAQTGTEEWSAPYGGHHVGHARRCRPCRRRPPSECASGAGSGPSASTVGRRRERGRPCSGSPAVASHMPERSRGSRAGVTPGRRPGGSARRPPPPWPTGARARRRPRRLPPRPA